MSGVWLHLSVQKLGCVSVILRVVPGPASSRHLRLVRPAAQFRPPESSAVGGAGPLFSQAFLEILTLPQKQGPLHLRTGTRCGGCGKLETLPVSALGPAAL